MRWFREGEQAVGSGDGDALNTTESGSGSSGASTLAAKAQRLAGLQEERHQLEQLPATSGGAIDGDGGFLAPAMPPAWHDRMLELECEIELLREEMLAEEAEEPSAHAGAAEEVGQQILDQIASCAATEKERELLYG